MPLRWSIRQFHSGFARNTLTLVSGSVGGQIIALLAYPVITRLYSPAEFGIQSVFMSMGLLLSALATGRYEQALLLPKNDEKAVRLMILILSLATGFMLLLFIPCMLWKNQLADLMGSSELIRWIPWLPVYTLILALSTAWNLFANRFSGYKVMSAYQLVQSGSTSGFRIGLSGIGSSGLICGTIIGQLSGLLTLVIPFAGKIKTEKGLSYEKLKEVGREYSNFPKFRMPSVFILFLSGNLPVFILSAFFSPAISGFYALAYNTVLRPVNLFVNSISQVFTQRFILHHNEGHPLLMELRLYLRRLFIIGIVPFIIVFAFGPWLFTIIFGDEWTVAGSYLRWMLPWLFLVYLVSGLHFLPDLFGKQKKAMVLDIILLGLRIATLAIGILMKDANLAILLFGACGILMPSYQLLWYRQMIRQHDSTIR